jgi:uncharacterized protein (DUF952 family)
MTVIYHITPRIEWEAARVAGTYAADSLSTEGYIHCSTAEQVIGTADRLFKGRADLVLLCIAIARVKAEIRYENLEAGSSLFPHVYGALDARSIIAVHNFPSRSDGGFDLPPALQTNAGA